jgi:MFS family permease
VFLAIIGAPLGGYLSDRWRKRRLSARMLVPAFTTLLSAILLFFAFTDFGIRIQYLLLLSVGISMSAFISVATVTQDVIHAGLRAISYAIAVILQNLLGASLGPLVMGAISDATNIQTAFKLLPIALLIAFLLFFIGSFYYERDLAKVENIELEVK